jgi:ACR3 family arsenite efflux pump ArsB
MEWTSKPERGFLRLLRRASLVAALAGAVGSIGFMLYAGRRNHSLLLPVLFTIWVLSPFVALGFAHLASKRWPVLTQATLYSLMLVLAPGSLAIYGHAALHPPKAQAAFVFVAVPPASWLLMAIVVPVSALISRRRPRFPLDK